MAILALAFHAAQAAAQPPAAAQAGAAVKPSAGAQGTPGDTPLTLLAGGALDLRWSSPPSEPLAAPPAFDDETAYVATQTGAVFAWDLDTGRVRWRVDAATALRPAVGGNRVFVVVAGGVRALDARTGAVAWQRDLPGAVAAPPYWDTGWLVLSFEGGDLAAFRGADGDLLWRAPLGAVAHVAPAPALDNLYLGLADGRTMAVELTSGRVVWSRTLGGVPTGLTALDDQLLVGTTLGALHSLDLRHGSVRWRFRTGGPVVASATADERRIYVVAYDHILRGLDRRSGNLRWRRALPHRPAGAPVLVGALVLVPSLATELATYDASTGAPALAIASTSEVAGSTHFRVGGPATGTRLLAVSVEGHLLAFAPRVELAPVALGPLPGATVAEPRPLQPARVPPPVAR